MDDAELEGFKSTRYFSRAWALLTKERGWVKPVLVMTVALLVPIVGWLGVMGYVAEWARLTAWGVNSAPKRRGVRVGTCIASGWRVFVVGFVWALCMAVIGAVAAAIPLLGGLAAFAWWIFSIFLSVVVVVAALRATIYQRIAAGLRVRTVWQMASHDAAGLIRVVGIEAIGMVIIWIVCAVTLIVSLANFLPQVLYIASYITRYEAILSVEMQTVLAFQLIGSLISSFGPALLVMYVVCGLIGVVLLMLVATSVALWIRQFDVASWGREEDPLNIPEDDASAASSQPEAPGIPGDAPAEKNEAPAAAAPDGAEPADEDEPEVVEVETIAVAPAAVEDGPVVAEDAAPEAEPVVAEDTEEPVEPAAETPVEPAAETPVEPAAETPAEPAEPVPPAETPAEPAASDVTDAERPEEKPE